MNHRKLLSLAGISELFGFGLNSDFKIPKYPKMNYKKGNGTAFTKGKRSKSLKVRSNRMKAKRK